jgi:hypothetical protein
MTQARLKALVNYDPETGFMRNKKAWSHARSLSHGYVQISLDGSTHLVHRLAFLYMTGSIPEQVNHKDINKTNNAWVNLESSNAAHNQRHAAPIRQRNNTSGCPGVTYDKQMRKWRAQMKKKGKMIYFGYSPDFFEACCLRKSGEQREWAKQELAAQQ